MKKVKNHFSASVILISLQLSYVLVHDVNTIYILPYGKKGGGMKSSPYVAKYVIRCSTEIP
jgi:hypothetical protein